MDNVNPSYIGPREDILELVPPDARRVLDVGCAIGALGERIRQRTGAEVIGIERDLRMAEAAGGKLDRVIVADIEEVDLSEHFAPAYFDCIILADVLEHLRNPREALRGAAAFLRPDGLVIASIPNVRHHSTVRSLVFGGRWPYRERGIHDRAHLRFFTLKNIVEMFGYAGLRITGVRRNYRIIERCHPLNRYSRAFAFPIVRDFFTFQYLVTAGKGEG